MTESSVRFECDTGYPNAVFSNLLIRVSAYTRIDRVQYFKIGITNDPNRRFKEAYKNEYDEMIAIYKTESISHARTLEIDLIEYYKEHCDNMITGGGGSYGFPPHYVYIVIIRR